MEKLDIAIIQKQTADQIEKERLENNSKHFFYKPTFKNGSLEKIKFRKAEFLQLLAQYNIFCLEIGIDTAKFVQMEANTIIEVSEKKIIKICSDHIKSLPEYREIITDGEASELIEGQPMIIELKIQAKTIYEYFLNNLENLFNRKLLSLTSPNNDIRFAEDTKTSKYLFFINGFVKVTAAGADLQPYENLDNKFIWKNQRLARVYEPADEQTGMFEMFTKRICGFLKPGDKNYELFEQKKFDKRFLAFKTILGYLLHNFMKGRIYAIIFTDSKISDEGEANGRSGKTLLGKSLGWMLNTEENSTVLCEISGRKFDVRDKHKYDKTNLDTKLIHLNDCYNNFNIEHLFTDISEGVEAKKLYEQPFMIYPKFLISTNKQIKISGESAKARVNIFEFSDWYNAGRGPDTEFNCWFGTDWDPLEWNRFTAFMISCIQEYLKSGLQVAEPINLKAKMAADHTNPDFIVWITSRLVAIDEEGNVNDNYIRVNKAGTTQKEAIKYAKRADLYDKFCIAYPDYPKKTWFDQRKFTMWVKFYFATVHPHIELKEYRGNETDYIYFIERETEQ